MIRHLLLLSLALSLAGAATDACTQQPNNPPIVGLVSFAAAPDDRAYEAFRAGLRELGYVEGRPIRIESLSISTGAAVLSA